MLFLNLGRPIDRIWGGIFEIWAASHPTNRIWLRGVIGGGVPASLLGDWELERDFYVRIYGRHLRTQTARPIPKHSI